MQRARHHKRLPRRPAGSRCPALTRTTGCWSRKYCRLRRPVRPRHSPAAPRSGTGQECLMGPAKDAQVGSLPPLEPLAPIRPRRSRRRTRHHSQRSRGRCRQPAFGTSARVTKFFRDIVPSLAMPLTPQAPLPLLKADWNQAPKLNRNHGTIARLDANFMSSATRK